MFLETSDPFIWAFQISIHYSQTVANIVTTIVSHKNDKAEDNMRIIYYIKKYKHYLREKIKNIIFCFEFDFLFYVLVLVSALLYRLYFTSYRLLFHTHFRCNLIHLLLSVGYVIKLAFPKVIPLSGVLLYLDQVENFSLFL